MGGKRKAKVSLRKGRDTSAKDGCELKSVVIRNGNGKKSCLVIINGETSGHLKVLESIFDIRNSRGRGTKKDKGVVRILKHSAGSIVNQWVIDNRKKELLLK